MKRVILLLLVLLCIGNFAQSKKERYWDFTFESGVKETYWTPNFAGFTTGDYTPYTARAYFGGDTKRQYARSLAVNRYFEQLTGAMDTFTISFRAKFKLPTESSQLIISANTWSIDFGVNYGALASFSGSGFVGAPRLTLDFMDSVRHIWLVKYNAGIGIRTYMDNVRMDSVGGTWNGGTTVLYYLTFGGANGGAISDTTTPLAGYYFKGELDSVVIAKYSGGRDTIAYYPFNEGWGQNSYTILTTKAIGASETTRDTLCSRFQMDRPNYTGAMPVTDLIVQRGWQTAPDVHDFDWVIESGSRPTSIDTAGYGTWYWYAVGNANLPAESYVLDMNWLNDSTVVVVNGSGNSINPTNNNTRTDTANYVSLLHWNRIDKNPKVYTTLSNVNYPLKSVVTTTIYNGDIFIGTSDSIKGIARTYGVSRWDIDTSGWKQVDSSLSNGSVVYTLEAYVNALIMGGAFSQIGNTSGYGNVAILRQPYGQWAKLGTGFNGGVSSSLVTVSGDTLFCGNFSTANGVSAYSIAKWNGTTFVALGTGIKDSSGNAGVARVMAEYKGYVYVGGYFDMAGGVYCHNIARWNGSTWSEPFPVLYGLPSHKVDGDVVDLKVAKVYQGGVQVDSVLVGVGTIGWVNNVLCYHGFIYNGSTITPLPSMDMRPEETIFKYSGDTTKFVIGGDIYGAYGVEAQNIVIAKATWNKN